ncbi:DinB family protein [Virgibacillus dakarensis]|uniref:DinB family protein n=1 Tax=Virgibacillus dakarensis TaxID=1917889 RepID=UPI000B454035|nr:DinB family protein [Virgibacillus dakarensis]
MSRYDFTRSSFLKFVRKLDENIIAVQPKGFRNTLHWHVGHVLVTTESFLFGYPKQSTNIPESYNDFFKSGTKPADWPEEVPALQEIISYLEEQLTRLNELSDKYMQTELTFTLPFGDFKTYGDLYDLSIHHEAEHLGQIKAMKRIIEA